MLTTPSLTRRILDTGTVDGRYVLPNGRVLACYFDEYRVAADPALLADTGKALAAMLPPNTDVIAGLELGGVPFAFAVSAASGLPTALVRKKAKSYGTHLQVEGAPIRGARVVMVDDVIRSGRQILIAAAALRHAQTIPTTAVAIVIRQGNARTLLARHDIAVLGITDETTPPTEQS
jgi:orotate phosphoribosyltransferase